MCNDSIGSEQGRVTNIRELFTYYIKSDQNGAVHDNSINDAVQQQSRYKKRKKKKKKVRHFRHGEKNDGQIHDQKKRNVNAVDVGLMGVWVKDPLQYDSAKPHGLSKKSDPLQKQKIQYGLVAEHNVQINGKMQENVSERSNESEQNGRKKKKKLPAVL